MSGGLIVGSTVFPVQDHTVTRPPPPVNVDITNTNPPNQVIQNQIANVPQSQARNTNVPVTPVTQVTPNPPRIEPPPIRTSSRMNKGISRHRLIEQSGSGSNQLMEQLPNAGQKVEIAPAMFMIDPPQIQPNNNLPDPKTIDPAAVTIPKNLNEAMESDFADYWAQAVCKELNGIDRLDTFRSITTDERLRVQRGEVKITNNRMIFSLKLNGDGTIARFKCRLVLQGYNHEKGVDYDSTFAPVVSVASIRFLLAQAVMNHWKVCHADVPNAFLNGTLEHLIVTKVPLGWNQFIGHQIGSDGELCALVKSLYGAKQASLCWNKRLDEFLTGLGFERCYNEACFYSHRSDYGIVLVTVWVDDLFYTGSDVGFIDFMKRQLIDTFAITDLGELAYSLGVRFRWVDQGLFMDQEKEVLAILERFHVTSGSPVMTPIQKGLILSKEMGPKNDQERKDMEGVPYAQLMGCLLYIARWTLFF